MPQTAAHDGALQEAIAGADYRAAARRFTGLLRDGEPLDRLVRSTVDIVAPFVQTPSHLMPLPDGRLRSVNFDHTILGWRASLRLAGYLGESAGRLPITQAIWYAPQGLNVWDQVQCNFPGHYARDQEKCDTKPAATADGEAPAHAFDGPAWAAPLVYFPDRDPIVRGPAEDRLRELVEAIREGQREQAYGLFLGLAQEPAMREPLKDATLMAGISDLQDTLVDRAGYQNIGHKALRARAMLDLADSLGWEDGHSLFYTVVPDLGSTPLLHALWSQATHLVEGQFRDTWRTLKRDNTAPLSPHELDQTIDVLLWGEQGDVLAHISQRLREGKALLAIGDAVVIAYSHYIANITEHPNALFIPGHVIDYCNVVHHWLRSHDNPHQVKAIYLEAAFLNDMIRANRLFPYDPAFALHPDQHAAWADALPLRDVLPALHTAITEQDADRTMALVDTYLPRSTDRADLLATIAFANCQFQNDPHIQRHCVTAFEEYELNASGRRDEIIRAAAKYAARCIKRSTEFGGYELFREQFGGA